MLKQKYVVIEYVSKWGSQMEAILIFPDLIDHCDMVPEGMKVVSAGFIVIGAEEKYKPTVQCYGKSITLGKESRPELDTRLAEKQILGNIE